MSLVNELNSRLKDAMKARRSEEVSVIRMIKSRITELQTSSSFKGEIDDQAVIGVITAYSKQMTKALTEFEKAGTAGAEQIDALKYEIEYLSPFLPTKLGEAETFKLVAEVQEREGINEAKMMGRLIGAVMKSHKDQVDPALVRKAAEQLLA
tara:strand:+ start:319 stop:774 length:456 start_codon:yes stop_codon:yes gene_type:complete